MKLIKSSLLVKLVILILVVYATVTLVKLQSRISDKKAEADADAAYAQAKETVLAELRQTFRPEFLNRIDDIIVFRALTEQNIEEVARRMLKTVADRMETMDIHLDASDEAVKELAKEGFDPKYGARPLRRAIQSKVEDAVAEEIQETRPQKEEESLNLNDNQRQMVVRALERNNGNRKKAAQELGISDRTLYRRIKEYGLEDK